MFHHSSKNIYFSVPWICLALIPFARLESVNSCERREYRAQIINTHQQLVRENRNRGGEINLRVHCVCLSIETCQEWKEPPLSCTGSVCLKEPFSVPKARADCRNSLFVCFFLFFVVESKTLKTHFNVAWSWMTHKKQVWRCIECRLI